MLAFSSDQTTHEIFLEKLSELHEENVFAALLSDDLFEFLLSFFPDDFFCLISEHSLVK